jgi:hypothetical protein
MPSRGPHFRKHVDELRAPNDRQHGARSWAGAGPNILNVAVTRAKQNLYVIGSRVAWSGISNFSALARYLPFERISSDLCRPAAAFPSKVIVRPTG